MKVEKPAWVAHEGKMGYCCAIPFGHGTGVTS